MLLIFWRYPLQEPRKALLAFFGKSDLGLAMLDTIIYCGEDALSCLAGGKSVEKDGKPPTTGGTRCSGAGSSGNVEAFCLLPR